MRMSLHFPNLLLPQFSFLHPRNPVGLRGGECQLSLGIIPCFLEACWFGRVRGQFQIVSRDSIKKRFFCQGIDIPFSCGFNCVNCLF